MQDLCMVAGDETHASHVGGERVDLIDASGRLEAVVPSPQIEQLELVCIRGAVLGELDVHAAHPVALLLQEGDEMVAYEATRTCDQYFLHLRPLHAPSMSLLPSFGIRILPAPRAAANRHSLHYSIRISDFREETSDWNSWMTRPRHVMQHDLPAPPRRSEAPLRECGTVSMRRRPRRRSRQLRIEMNSARSRWHRCALSSTGDAAACSDRCHARTL